MLGILKTSYSKNLTRPKTVENKFLPDCLNLYSHGSRWKRLGTEKYWKTFSIFFRKKYRKLSKWKPDQLPDQCWFQKYEIKEISTVLGRVRFFEYAVFRIPGTFSTPDTPDIYVHFLHTDISRHGGHSETKNRQGIGDFFSRTFSNFFGEKSKILKKHTDEPPFWCWLQKYERNWFWTILSWNRIFGYDVSGRVLPSVSIFETGPFVCDVSALGTNDQCNKNFWPDPDPMVGMWIFTRSRS